MGLAEDRWLRVRGKPAASIDLIEAAINIDLSGQGKYEEAEELLQAALAARRRVLGSAHPDTLATARILESMRSKNALGAREV